jgi:hypothetical protein
VIAGLHNGLDEHAGDKFGCRFSTPRADHFMICLRPAACRLRRCG